MILIGLAICLVVMVEFLRLLFFWVRLLRLRFSCYMVSTVFLFFSFLASRLRVILTGFWILIISFVASLINAFCCCVFLWLFFSPCF